MKFKINWRIFWISALAGLLLALSFQLANAQPYNRGSVKWQKQLGYELFFDKLISSDGSTSCASCHHPSHGWADGRVRAIGMINNGSGFQGTFNSPTILNARFKIPQFWDGRANGLSDQALQPMTNPIEMGNVNLTQVTNRLQQIPRYRRLFGAAFGTYGITETRMAYALASFESDIVSYDAPIDKYLAGDKSALSKKQKRGWFLVNFMGCVNCHDPNNDFRDGIAHNTGIALRTIGDNEGGFRNRRAFMTPTWRELKRTAPYMHNGSVKDIRTAILHYVKGARYIAADGRTHVDPLLDPLVNKTFKASENDISAIEDFLLNATAGVYPTVVDPFTRRKNDDSTTANNGTTGAY